MLITLLIIIMFQSLHEYETNLNKYLKKNNLEESFKNCKLDALKRVIDQLNMNIYEDIKLLSYLTVDYQNKLIIIFDYLMTKIDLDFFEDKILNNIPALHVVGFNGFTPLGGFRAQSTIGIDYYNCIKFIGLNTKTQEIYDKCIEILKKMPEKLEGRIINPSEVMYLLKYNFNVDTTKNNKGIKTVCTNKLHDLTYSVYRPNPSFEKEYNTYKHKICAAYEFNAQSNQNFMTKICFMNNIIKRQKYRILNDISKISDYCKFDDEINDEIKKTLFDIHNQKFDLIDEKNDDFKIIKVGEAASFWQDKINEELKILDESDENEISTIGSDAYICASDNNYNKKNYEHDRLIAIYEIGLAKIDSKFSHNLMRNAVDSGRLWLVKFLVSKGVTTKNIPVYGQKYKWEFEALQLSDILKQDYRFKSWTHSPEYVAKKQAARKIIQDYLMENNLI
jgi:hypothetical protein